MKKFYLFLMDVCNKIGTLNSNISNYFYELAGKFLIKSAEEWDKER